MAAQGKRRTIQAWEDATPGVEVFVEFPHKDALVNPKMRNATEMRRGVLGTRNRWGVIVHFENGSQIDVQKLDCLILP